jgi:hypothetical protein
MTTPADIGNRALDAAGWEGPMIGDLEEGTDQAKPILRAYGPALRQLLRTAHWNMARKQAPLALLADATGQTPNVGTLVPTPWIYEYQWPIDAVKARFVPWNTQQAQNLTPQFSGSYPLVQGPPAPGTISVPNLNVVNPFSVRLIPARFLVTLDYNYPALVGAITDWGQIPDVQSVEGVGGPENRTVILTNVQNASLVYTALVIYPDEWDSLFEEAFVQLLASRVALPLAKDKKLGRAIRAEAIAACKDAIAQARVTDGNEMWSSVDHRPDWLRARNAGAGWNAEFAWGEGSGPGVFSMGWDTISFGDGGAAY